MAKIADMDDFDHKILSLIQQNNLLTHNQIGEHIGLSPSAVRRRLGELRKRGVVIADVARVHPDDFGVTLIVTVSFGEETPATYDEFDRQMRDLAPVKQSYHVAGSNDYVVIVHGPSLRWFEQWGRDVFMSNPAIRRYSTSVVWSCKKFETAIATA
ncbi:MAG: Lrp/AsnC family transcriptional regulator [Pseudomonadota bacterium]